MINITKKTLLGAAVFAASISAHSMSAPPQEIVPVSDDYRVMTYNIGNKESANDARWEARYGAVIRAIEENQADIIGVQEAYHSQLHALDHGYHYFGGEEGVAIVELWKDAEIELSDTHVRVGQGSGGLTIGKYNAIYIDKVRFDVLESGTRWFSVKGLKESAFTAVVDKKVAEVSKDIALDALSAGDAVDVDFSQFENRTLTYAKLFDKGTERTIWVFNTQMFEGTEETSKIVLSAARTLAVTQLRDFIFEKAKTGDVMEPVVLLGSFGDNYLNLPMSIALSQEVDGAALKDDFYSLNQRWWAAGTPADDSETYHNYGQISGVFGSPVYPVDWTYSGGQDAEGLEFRRISSSIDKNQYLDYANGQLIYASDHYPLVTEYSFDITKEQVRPEAPLESIEEDIEEAFDSLSDDIEDVGESIKDFFGGWGW